MPMRDGAMDGAVRKRKAAKTVAGRRSVRSGPLGSPHPFEPAAYMHLKRRNALIYINGRSRRRRIAKPLRYAIGVSPSRSINSRSRSRPGFGVVNSFGP